MVEKMFDKNYLSRKNGNEIPEKWVENENLGNDFLIKRFSELNERMFFDSISNIVVEY